MAERKSYSAEYAEFNRRYGYRKVNPLWIYLAAAALSALWIGWIWYYAAHSAYTPDKLMKMMPHEFGGFLAGTIMPVGFVWVVAVYIDRNMNSNYEREVIYPFLQGIIDPHGDQGAIISVIREKLAVETGALAAAADRLSDLYSKMSSITSSGSAHIESALASTAEYDSRLSFLSLNLEKLAGTLHGGLSSLSEAAEGAQDKAQSAANSILSQSAALKYSLEQTTAAAESILEEIEAKRAALDSTASFACEKASLAASFLERAGETAGAAAGALETRADQILARVEDKTGQFVIKASIAAEKISSAASGMEKSSDFLASASTEMRKASGEAIDKISQYSGFVAERLAAQSKLFEDKSGAIIAKVNSAQEGFELLGASAGRSAEAIVAAMKNVAAETASQQEALAAAANEASSQIARTGRDTEEAKDGLVRASAEIRSAGEASEAALRGFAAQFEQRAAYIRESILEIDKAMRESSENLAIQAESALKSAGDIKAVLKRQIDDLAECANSVATRTRMAEASIEAQKKQAAD
ncbi:MAG: hypothetical protein LBH41_01360, partial [Rickettsiales bacterium]|nr:hypothetical protein [Rickettsiales bacterium]